MTRQPRAGDLLRLRKFYLREFAATQDDVIVLLHLEERDDPWSRGPRVTWRIWQPTSGIKLTDNGTWGSFRNIFEVLE